jgi:N-acetylmuramoyl-L-alanine amidase
MKTRSQPGKGTPVLRRRVLVAASRAMLMLALVSFTVAGLIVTRVFTIDGDSRTNAPATSLPPSSPSPQEISPDAQAPAEAAPPVTPIQAGGDPPANTQSKRVGIVAGHAGYDPGAVCEDGLTEAEVNMAVAREVVVQLSNMGYQVDLMEEFDDRLMGYRADVLVSIHADSCDIPGASGFKVARVTYSAIPDAEDMLVECLYAKYGTITGLPSHPNSITDNMTNYHAFSEIDPYTPGAIIETGFLLEDRHILVTRPGLIAQGIVSGVLCFLEEN